MVFDDILNTLLKGRKIQSRNDFLEKLIADSRYKKIIRNSIKFKMSASFLEILDRFLYDIPYQWIEFEDVYYEGRRIVTKQKLKGKVTGRTETPLGIKLEQLENYIMELIFGTEKGREYKEGLGIYKEKPENGLFVL